MTDRDPKLAHQVERGEYVVDSEAVAAAIVERLAQVLEPGERSHAPVALDERRARPRDCSA